MSALRQPALDAQHCKRSTRGIAALVELAGAGPRPGLLLGIDGDNTVAEWKLSRHGKVHQRARGFHRDDLEMDGVAADHAAKRNRRVIGLAVLLGGIKRDRDGRWNLQRA